MKHPYSNMMVKQIISRKRAKLELTL